MSVSKQSQKIRAFQVSIDSPGPQGQFSKYYVRKSSETIKAQGLWALGLVPSIFFFFPVMRPFVLPCKIRIFVLEHHLKVLIKSWLLGAGGKKTQMCMIQLCLMLVLQLISYSTISTHSYALGKHKDGILK